MVTKIRSDCRPRGTRFSRHCLNRRCESLHPERVIQIDVKSLYGDEEIGFSPGGERMKRVNTAAERERVIRSGRLFVVSCRGVDLFRFVSPPIRPDRREFLRIVSPLFRDRLVYLQASSFVQRRQEKPRPESFWRSNELYVIACVPKALTINESTDPVLACNTLDMKIGHAGLP